MAETVYDRHTQFYVDFVDRGRQAAATRGYDHMLARIEARLGEALSGARVCDLCCGEGYVGRWLMRRGAREVVGVDLSQTLIEIAKARADDAGLSYIASDAAKLDQVGGAAFDLVVCHMGMHDVSDHRALFKGVRRVLETGAPFVFTLLHPCFMAPCHAVEAPPWILGDDGRAVAVVVRRYATEGYWNSGGDGVRGRMGAHHRMISTYVNDLLASGFALEALEELGADQAPHGAPTALSDASGGDRFAAEVPYVLLVAARAV
jgi:SAM-dependent methyltransferase